MNQFQGDDERAPDFPAICGRTPQGWSHLTAQWGEPGAASVPREAKLQLRSSGRQYPVWVRSYPLERNMLGFDVWAVTDIARRRLLVDCELSEAARLRIEGLEFTVQLGTYAPLVPVPGE